MSVSSAKHLATIQPEWEDLPLACELLELRYKEPEHDLRVLASDRGNVGSKKIQQVIRLLRLLGLLDDGKLTSTGQWLAVVFDQPVQQSYFGSKLGIGLKSTLSTTEKLLLWMVIYYEHHLPVLATLHQLSTEVVPTKQDSPAVQRLAERISELYPSVNSMNSWTPRAKVHYKWMTHLGLSRVHSNRYTLTADGKAVFEQVEPECPSEWEPTSVYQGTTLSDF